MTSITSTAAGLVHGVGRRAELAPCGPPSPGSGREISEDFHDKVVDFQSRLAAREVEYAEYNKRMQHLGALFEMMSPVISKMRELGADERAIARALRVIVEELEALEPQRPAG